VSLTPGTRLGVYVVANQIGEGGMGQVYRATDTRLKRPVAIKILPPTLSADADQLARFQREAEVLASLNHPHIAAIYGLEESGGIIALVMELVEGEDLSKRIERGPIPLDEALQIASQIAEALEAAHEQGIIHRDLKPTNIKVRPDGTVKVFDFGLAKAVEPRSVSSPAATVSPTVTTRAMTQTGLILGSVPYMSPEQARGKVVDKRTDVWAFGCVLYEMLTGKRAFGGDDLSETLARVIEREPSWDELPAGVPGYIRQTLRLCLRKPLRERIPDMGAVRLALQGAFDSSGAPAAATPAGRSSIWWASAAALAAAASLAVGVVLGGRVLTRTAPPAPLTRFEVEPPSDVTLAPAPIASAAQLAVSPDGRHLAFVAARRRGVSQLWVRPLDSVVATPLPGTDGASFPFWSPDSQSLAFFAAGKLKTIDIAGGTPRVLCDANTGRGGSWSSDGTIAFAANINGPLSQIAASGGAPTSLTALDPAQGAISHYFPQFLPDGQHFFYFQRSTKSAEYGGVFVGTRGSPGAKRLLNIQSMAFYSSGFVWFAQGGTLFAQPFDLETLQTTNEPIRVAEGIGYYQGIGYAGISVSATGIIAHGPPVVLNTSIQQRTRAGIMEGTLTPPGSYRSPTLSPDQRSLAMSVSELGGSPSRDVWVRDLGRGTMSRISSDPLTDWFPVWLPDSRRLFFGSNRLGSTTVFEKVLGGNEELFAETSAFSGSTAYPLDVSSDARFLLLHTGNMRGYDLHVLNLTGERKASVFLSTPFNEVQGRFAPNGRWIAYTSDESGRFEIYVRPFPSGNEQTQISLAGGMQPEWRRDGRELFYLSADGALTAVPVSTDAATFTAGTPQPLFDVDVPEASAPYPRDYAVTADGQHFFVNTVIDQPIRPALTVILNWTEQARK
jgi:Tol biopolymer transport system component